jgi:hypothetical protein
MALDGRITVDVLFHDTDGTASLKVASLEDSQEYTSGKVAIVTGTAGTSGVTVYSGGTTTPAYRDASGSIVSFSDVSRVALLGTPAVQISEPGPGRVSARSSGELAIVSCFDSPGTISVASDSGTASYTLVLYGS